MFNNPKILTLSATVAGLAIMFAIESIFPARSWETPRKLRIIFHASLAIFNAAIVGLIATTPLMFWTGLVHSRGWGISSILGLSGMVEILASLVVLDMFDYWWHRFNHQIPFLWRFHKVHHVDTHVDVTTSLRFHPGELLIANLAVKSIWFIIWGPSLTAILIFQSAVTAASQFHHTNIDFTDALENAIRKIIVTPRYHASHHAVSKTTARANYCTIFIFWDKIFGSYREPVKEELGTLGLTRGRKTNLSYASTLRGPFSSEY
jgi:sterol desaturase/sphingolipid hydroxylase (fatty acid hydroxylase superfamily)